MKSKCKQCKAPATIMVNLHSFCSYDHATEWAMAQKAKAYKAETVRRKRELLDNDKDHWKAKAKKACHLYNRTRDRYLPCISCGTIETKQWDAGHYIPSHRGAITRYDERNINKQCCQCNDGNKGSGNITMYRIGLVKKIGVDQVEELESICHEVKRWTLQELKDIHAHYTAKLKGLQDGD